MERGQVDCNYVAVFQQHSCSTMIGSCQQGWAVFGGVRPGTSRFSMIRRRGTSRLPYCKDRFHQSIVSEVLEASTLYYSLFAVR